MKTTLSSRTHRYLAIISIFLIMITSIAGMVGCNGDGGVESYTLTITSTAGGSVTEPEEEASTHDEGTVVNLVAEPEEGYSFVNWTGEVDTIADVNDATTTITMSDDYHIAANFAPGDGHVESYTLTITSTAGGSVTEPEEEASTHDEGTVVNLVAEPEEGYSFVNWTGEVDTVADVNDATTTITMSDDYHITANFAPVTSAITVSDWYDLDAVRTDLNNDYFLINDLDSTTAGYQELASSAANQGKGWDPIGTRYEPFTGTFDGQGHEVRDMVINRPARNYTGLFGAVGLDVGAGGVIIVQGVVKNLGVVDAAVTGDWNVGGVVGMKADTGTVTNCHFRGDVTGSDHVGGLMGFNYGALSDSYATGSVTGEEEVGGLVGFSDGTVSNCYATGSVTGGMSVGGLVGTAGPFYYLGNVSDCYSTGSVTGNLHVGGLVGYSYNSTVSDSYATGSVTGNSNVGGLVGKNYQSTVSNSFWDTQTSGQSTSGGGTGKTTAQMKSIATFSGEAWNIIAVANPSMRNVSYIWNIVDGQTYPFLSWQSV